MPELPEVETMVRGLRPHVEGRRVVDVRRLRCRYKPILLAPSVRQVRQRVVGQTIDRVSRLAKRVLLEFSNDEILAIEPRMSGLMLLGAPPDRRHLRFEWRLSGGGSFDRLWFWDRRGLGTIRLYSRAELARELGPRKLGPDALTISAVDLSKRCVWTGRPIKVALLDQSWMAGIGNLYANEILHRARIHPARPANTLASAEVRGLRRAIRQVLAEAIRYEGSTLGDGTYRNALNQNGRYQNRHRVYGKQTRLCPTCRRAHIERIVQCQRSTFFCPACQS